jgi:hypothetical protein
MVFGLTAKPRKIKSKEPDIKCLQQSIPRESLRALLDEGYRQDRKSNAGGKRIGQRSGLYQD